MYGSEKVNEPISYDEINKAVQELKPNKSPGVDTIPNEILKLNPFTTEARFYVLNAMAFST